MICLEMNWFELRATLMLMAFACLKVKSTTLMAQATLKLTRIQSQTDNPNAQFTSRFFSVQVLSLSLINLVHQFVEFHFIKTNKALVANTTDVWFFSLESKLVKLQVSCSHKCFGTYTTATNIAFLRCNLTRVVSGVLHYAS